jgi:cobalt-zinc-cadmium efflux system protein
MTKEDDYNHKATVHLSFALVLNLIFNVIVIVGGLLTNSIAILADAVHDVGDTLAIFIAWFLQKFSEKGRDSDFTYGYKRFSVLGAAITSTIVICACFVVLWEAINRFFQPVTPSSTGMLLVAILGVILKGLSIYSLYGGKTFNERSIYVHLFGDVIEWIVVLILSIVLIFVNIPILDPLASIAISLWIIYNLGTNLYRSLKVLVQRVPDKFDIESFKNQVLDINGVTNIQDLHVWSLDGLSNVISIKINVSNDNNLENLNHIKSEINWIAKEFNVIDSTIEIKF